MKDEPLFFWSVECHSKVSKRIRATSFFNRSTHSSCWTSPFYGLFQFACIYFCTDKYMEWRCHLACVYEVWLRTHKRGDGPGCVLSYPVIVCCAKKNCSNKAIQYTHSTCAQHAVHRIRSITTHSGPTRPCHTVIHLVKWVTLDTGA